MNNVSEQEPMEITRAQWDGFPRQYKRKWKDGTRLVLLTTTDNEKKWVKVFWKK